MQTDTKKTEKLATAIYMVTSFFSDLEPMKWRLRGLGDSLVSTGEKRQIVQEILSLLTIGKHAGLISDMNFEIIHREFSRLLPESESLLNIFVPSELEKPLNKPDLYISSSITPDRTAPVLKDIHQEEAKDKKGLKEFGVVAVKKNSRQSIIINLLKRKKEIMIKDVSPLIDGVSEKTIQRELLAMVKAGILRKEGEKRWSKYSLAE